MAEEKKPPPKKGEAKRSIENQPPFITDTGSLPPQPAPRPQPKPGTGSLVESSPSQRRPRQVAPVEIKRTKPRTRWGLLLLVAAVSFAAGYFIHPMLNPAEAAAPTEVPPTEAAPLLTEEPTAAPTEEPTIEPTAAPTEEPAVAPTEEPTSEPVLDAACTEVLLVSQVERGTMISIAVTGLEEGIYPAEINNYLAAECNTDPNYPSRLFCYSSRLPSGGGNTIVISDDTNTPFCELRFSVP